MSVEKKLQEGFEPEKIKKWYQPEKSGIRPDGEPTGGYKPTPEPHDDKIPDPPKEE